MHTPTTGLHSSRPATGGRWTRARWRTKDRAHDCVGSLRILGTMVWHGADGPMTRKRWWRPTHVASRPCANDTATSHQPRDREVLATLRDNFSIVQTPPIDFR